MLISLTVPLAWLVIVNQLLVSQLIFAPTPCNKLIRPYTPSSTPRLNSIIQRFEWNMCGLVSVEGQGHDLQHMHTNSYCDHITNMTHKSHLQGWPFTLLSHASSPPPPLNSPLKPLNGSRGLRRRWKHCRWPQAPRCFIPSSLPFSLTPPFWLGGYHTGSNLEIFPPPPVFFSPPLHPP